MIFPSRSHWAILIFAAECKEEIFILLSLFVLNDLALICLSNWFYRLPGIKRPLSLRKNVTAFGRKLKGNYFEAFSESYYPLLGLLFSSRYWWKRMRRKKLMYGIGLHIILLFDDLLNSHYHSAYLTKKRCKRNWMSTSQRNQLLSNIYDDYFNQVLKTITNLNGSVDS